MRIGQAIKRVPWLYRWYRPVQRWESVLRDELITRHWTRTSEVTTPLGFKLVAGTHPAYGQMRAGTFEPEETAIIDQALTECQVFVDIGANLGYFTLLAARRVPVLAVEPQPANLACLYQNLLINDLARRVEVFPIALSDSAGLLTLYGASGLSASLIKGWGGYSERNVQIVPVNTLDRLLGGRFLEERLLIKIDVEGAEHMVLAGGAETLQRPRRPIWLVEIDLSEHYPGKNPRFMEIFQRFWQLGYSACLPSGQPVDVSLVEQWVQAGRAPSYNFLFR